MKASSGTSIALIRKSLGETADYLGSQYSDLWENGFYQYVNRMAHLFFEAGLWSGGLPGVSLFCRGCHPYPGVPVAAERGFGVAKIAVGVEEIPTR